MNIFEKFITEINNRALIISFDKLIQGQQL